MAGPDTEAIVGAVRSMTIVFADAMALGPVVVVPVTEFAFSCKIKLPSVQLVTVIEYVVPDPLTPGVLHVEVPPN